MNKTNEILDEQFDIWDKVKFQLEYLGNVAEAIRRQKKWIGLADPNISQETRERIALWAVVKENIYAPDEQSVMSIFTRQPQTNVADLVTSKECVAPGSFELLVNPTVPKESVGFDPWVSPDFMLGLKSPQESSFGLIVDKNMDLLKVPMSSLKRSSWGSAEQDACMKASIELTNLWLMGKDICPHLTIDKMGVDDILNPTFETLAQPKIPKKSSLVVLGEGGKKGVLYMRTWQKHIAYQIKHEWLRLLSHPIFLNTYDLTKIVPLNHSNVSSLGEGRPYQHWNKLMVWVVKKELKGIVESFVDRTSATTMDIGLVGFSHAILQANAFKIFLDHWQSVQDKSLNLSDAEWNNKRPSLVEFSWALEKLSTYSQNAENHGLVNVWLKVLNDLKNVEKNRDVNWADMENELIKHFLPNVKSDLRDTLMKRRNENPSQGTGKLSEEPLVIRSALRKK